MKIRGALINTKNIAYVDYDVFESNGYNYRRNVRLYIHFIGNTEKLTFIFYEDAKDELDKTMKELEEKLS